MGKAWRRGARWFPVSKRELVLLAALLLLTVPLQLLVQWKVITGIPPEGAHAHAHAHEHEVGGEHSHEEVDHGEEDHGEEDLGDNLIPNYGFEVGTREQAWGWHPRVNGSSVVFRDEKVRRRGTASGAVAGEAVSSGPSGWAFSLPVIPRGRGLLLRGFVLSRLERGGAYFLFRASRHLENGEVVPLVEASRVQDESLYDWEEMSLAAAVPPDADLVEVEVGMYGLGKAWFDDLSLEVVEAPELPVGTNAITNPSFEDGLEGWLPFGERGEGDGLSVEGTPGRRSLVLRSDGGKAWGVCQGLSGLPSSGKIGIEIRAGSQLEDGKAYLDLFVFYPRGPSLVRVGELAGAGGVRTFKAEVPLEEGPRGAWVGLAVDGRGALWVEEVKLTLDVGG